MSPNEIITDILYLLYVNELVAENFIYAEKDYQQAITEAQKAGLIIKTATAYQLTEKGTAIVEGGGSYSGSLNA
jgi:predicted transcriptional regulator